MVPLDITQLTVKYKPYHFYQQQNKTCFYYSLLLTGSRWLSSGMPHCVILQMLINISEDFTASITRVIIIMTMMMMMVAGAVSYVSNYHTTQCNIPENSHLHCHYENIKSH
jgi:hypothetical protein